MDPMSIVSPFIMAERNDATNLFEDSVELSHLQKYVHLKRNDNRPGFNIMHVLVAAYIRAIASTPGVNRFLSGYRVYARKNIQVIMEVKKRLELNAPGTMMKFNFMPDATVDEVYEQMSRMINEYKESSDEPSTFDKLCVILKFLPRFLLKFFIWVLKRMDYNDHIPQSLLDLSPFHGSIVITSMASLNIKPVYHHLYNFGNVPVFMAFSTKRHEYGVNKDGEKVGRHYLDFRFSTDERICDGQYYATAINNMLHSLKNPSILDNPPETVVEDIK